MWPSTNAIYGTFASVPIFLLWLYVSWMIIMLGSEIAFATQNHGTIHMERAAASASVRSKITLGLTVLLDAARKFECGEVGLDVATYAQEHRVPGPVAERPGADLVRGGLLAELAEAPDRYVMLKSPDKIAVHDVVDLITQDGSAPEELGLAKIDPADRKSDG